MGASAEDVTRVVKKVDNSCAKLERGWAADHAMTHVSRQLQFSDAPTNRLHGGTTAVMPAAATRSSRVRTADQ